MSIRIGPYSGLGTAVFTVGTSTAITFNSSTSLSSGSTIATIESSGANKVTRCLVSASANLRFSVGGGTPTSSTYHKLTAGDVLEVDVYPERFKCIGESAATIYVDYMGA